MQGLEQGKEFYRYAVTVEQRDRSDLRIDPQKSLRLEPGVTLRDRLAPQSVTVYSTYRRAHDEDGIIMD